MNWKSKDVDRTVDISEICLSDCRNASEILLNFYKALGWDNDKYYLDPIKVRTTETIYFMLFRKMSKFNSDAEVGMLLVDKGPGVDNFIQEGKVVLLKGWVSQE